MPAPDKKALLRWAERYVSLWNAGDKQAWIENWKSVAPGDFRMLDPVGTPEKRGFEECCEKPFDLFQPRVRFRIQPGALFVCGNEVAWLLENQMTVDGETSVQHSIETYRFGDDGSCVVRTWYRVPERSESELGDMFEEYLPER